MYRLITWCTCTLFTCCQAVGGHPCTARSHGVPVPYSRVIRLSEDTCVPPSHMVYLYPVYVLSGCRRTYVYRPITWCTCTLWTPVCRPITWCTCTLLRVVRLSEDTCTARSHGIHVPCLRVVRLSEDTCVPPDHMVYLVESLTVICHFCMIDSSQQVRRAFLNSEVGMLVLYRRVCQFFYLALQLYKH